MDAREAGIRIGALEPGPHDAITDVAGVHVGQTTLVEGDGPLRIGEGPVRTGVTVIVPHAGIWAEPVFAGCHRLNGNGELTGLEWIRESGLLTTAIGLTNTHSVGVVRDALVRAHFTATGGDGLFWSLPVVGETWDGVLNDVNGQHVRAEHVHEALAGAASGPVAQGGVGGGTGMICHGFKGGTGTASRRAGDFTVGALVQANHGRRERLRIEGVAVGEAIGASELPIPEPPEVAAPGAGSIIVVLATDAPLLPHQCTRLAQRAGLGIARVGGVGEHTSGDLFLAFATGNRGLPADALTADPPPTLAVTMLADARMTALFDAAVEATEAAIVNALLAAETMTGRDGVVAHALPAARVAELVGR